MRSVAFSSQGCYLVSGGDEGQTKLWVLTPNGKQTSDISGKVISTSAFPVNAVDIHLTNKDVLTLSGTTEERMVGEETERLFKLGCDLNNSFN